MSVFRSFVVCLLLGCLFVGSVFAAHADAENADAIAAEAALTITVSDFAGADKETGRFLAETLFTNLAQSSRLHLVERTQIRNTFAELKLQSTGLTAPQPRTAARLANADRVIVGSYLVSNETMTINIRLLDVKTGQVIPHGAASVSGDAHSISKLASLLARQFHRRVTGAELEAGSAMRFVRQTKAPEDKPAQEAHPTNDTFAGSSLIACQKSGYIPKKARANGAMTEADLILLVQRVAQDLSAQSEHPFTASDKPGEPVSRLRVLAALLKITETGETLAALRDDPQRPAVADDKDTPTWGKPFVALALQKGWISQDDPFRANNKATWAFAAALLVKMPLNIMTDSPEVAPSRRADPDSYTGLVIDTGDLKLERGESARIVDEDGNPVYPAKDLPLDYDYITNHGIVSYVPSVVEAKRAGDHPLVITALRVSGNFHQEIVVANADAERIRAAEKAGHFLCKWAVCFVLPPN